MSRVSLVVLVACLLPAACAGSADSGSEPEAQKDESASGPQGPAVPGPEAEEFSEDGDEVASNEGAQATETNFVPAVCLADTDCPPDVRCVPFGDAGAGPGTCGGAEATSEEQP